MAWGGLARFEWILVELLVLGVLVWQLVSVRRAIRADRAKRAREGGER
jgi:hypothetical protein